MPFECDCCYQEIATRGTIHDAEYGDPVMEDANGDLVAALDICENCADREPKRVDCPSCGREVGEDDLSYNGEIELRMAGGGYYSRTSIACNRCWRENTFTCVDCGEFCHNRYSCGEHNGGEICESCRDNYCRCEDCGILVSGDDVLCDDDGDTYCEDCYGNNSSRLVHNYGYSPDLEFFRHGKASSNRAANGVLYFGCELEVNVASDRNLDHAAQEVLDSMGEDRVYLKEDGSIGRGFEIVTHPHDWESIKALWSNDWRENIKGVSSHASGRCGFHVHVNRSALTPMHIQKIVVFANAPENWELVKRVAQRDCESWAKLKSDKKMGKCGRSHDRYEAINLQNDDTIEFRIFRGNTRKDRILKNLEFVKATIEFTRDRSYRELRGEDFIKFVADNRKQYPNLNAFIGAGNTGEDN